MADIRIGGGYVDIYGRTENFNRSVNQAKQTFNRFQVEQNKVNLNSVKNFEMNTRGTTNLARGIGQLGNVLGQFDNHTSQFINKFSGAINALLGGLSQFSRMEDRTPSPRNIPTPSGIPPIIPVGRFGPSIIGGPSTIGRFGSSSTSKMGIQIGEDFYSTAMPEVLARERSEQISRKDLLEWNKAYPSRPKLSWKDQVSKSLETVNLDRLINDHGDLEDHFKRVSEQELNYNKQIVRLSKDKIGNYSTMYKSMFNQGISEIENSFKSSFNMIGSRTQNLLTNSFNKFTKLLDKTIGPATKNIANILIETLGPVLGHVAALGAAAYGIYSTYKGIKSFWDGSQIKEITKEEKEGFTGFLSRNLFGFKELPDTRYIDEQIKRKQKGWSDLEKSIINQLYKGMLPELLAGKQPGKLTDYITTSTPSNITITEYQKRLPEMFAKSGITELKQYKDMLVEHADFLSQHVMKQSEIMEYDRKLNAKLAQMKEMKIDEDLIYTAKLAAQQDIEAHEIERQEMIRKSQEVARKNSQETLEWWRSRGKDVKKGLGYVFGVASELTKFIPGTITGAPPDVARYGVGTFGSRAADLAGVGQTGEIRNVGQKITSVGSILEQVLWRIAKNTDTPIARLG